MDRWAARAQRKSDERAARWQERQRERARSGQMTAADRWAARAQRKSDERAARWQELEPLRQLVTAAPIRGPGDSAAVISIDQSGPRWLSPLNPVGPIGPGGPLEALRLLITEAIWLVVFRRSYTVHVRTNDHPPIKIHVRLRSEIAACHAAAHLVSRFQDDGPAALQSWRAETSASTHTASRFLPTGS
jgi:hypothetical protein